MYKNTGDTPHGASAPTGQPITKNPVIAELHVEIANTKNIMQDNIERIAERGQHLDALHDRTGGFSGMSQLTVETLHYQSQLFNSTAKKTRNKMFWSNKKVRLGGRREADRSGLSL